MSLQRLGIVGALVAEQRTKLLVSTWISDQTVPIIVADFMAKVAEQRAVALVQAHAHLLALGVVGLAQVEGDETLGVTGQHALAADALLDVERQALFGVVTLREQGQIERIQAVDEAALGLLYFMPEPMILRLRQVGDDIVEAAGLAELFARIGRH